MASADWYFDFVSPFSYLQCEQLPQLERSIRVRYRPVLFAGLLKASGHKGPAEIPAKRRFTYQFVAWQAKRLGVPSKFINFPDEGHWVLKPKNSEFWHKEVFAWLKQYCPPGGK